MTGKIIAFEGLPNAGKTVNVALLKKDFPNFNYVPELATMLFEMEGILSGENTTDEIAKTFWKYEIERSKKAYEDKLKGDIVIFDRNIFSCLTHTFASEQHEIHKKEASEYFSGAVPYPDVYIYIVISPETSIARRGNRKFENMGPLEHIQRMANAYNLYFNRHPASSKIIRVSGEPPIEQVYTNIRKAIETALKT
ncbi:hypothetical protein D4Q76_01985 [archaeon]|nr:MAG: hypothetical protein D4Q76_01985 [archaeon]